MESNRIARGTNGLGNSLLSHLAAKGSDGSALFLSPWGVGHVLALLLEGASPISNSYQQIQNALFAYPEAPLSREYIHNAVQSLSNSITVSSDDKELIVSDACSVWVKPGVQLRDDYVKAVQLYFNAKAQNFTNASVVNSWVDKETRGKIKTIVDDGVVRNMSVLLLSAIYFKGLWEAPFSKRQTRQWDFDLLDGSQMSTPMMFLHKKAGTELQGARFQAPLNDEKHISCVAAKIAYKGGAYSAVIALPEGEIDQGNNGNLTLRDNGQDYALALSSCRETVLAGFTPQLQENKKKNNNTDPGIEWRTIGSEGMAGIRLYLPRFEIEFEAHLANALKAAGLGSIFGSGDFSEITDSGDMYVSDVIQKVYVKADESGTEAAAVTAAIKRCKRGGSRASPPPELIVKCDRPFIFAIVHEESGLALFVGEIYKPEEWKSDEKEDTSD